MVDALCVILVRVTAQLHMSELKDALILSSIRSSQSDIHLFVQSAKCTLIQMEIDPNYFDLVESIKL